MSKIRTVEIITQNGSNYGQISQPADLVKAQEFAHAHAEQVTRDFLTEIDGEVSGCNISLAALLSVTVAAGRIYQAGLQYEFQNQTIALPAAHNQFARLDTVVATLAVNVPTNNEFLAFQRLRTEQELNAAAPPYPPTQFQRATERWNVATIAVRAGVPSATPQPIALAANEVALYQITVPANATALQLANVGDVRKIVANLRAVSTQVKSHGESLSTHATQIQQALAFEQLQRDYSSVFGEPGTKSLLQILQIIASKLLVLKYRFPSLATSDGRCPAAVNQNSNGSYVIDIPIGTLVQFGDRFHYVDAKFAQEITSNQAAVSAQYSNTSDAPEQSYQSLFENDEDAPIVNGNAAPGGNVIRINAPTTQKWLYINYDGELFFRNNAQPSSTTECLLMRITPNQGAAPTLKLYRNLRNSSTTYSKTYATGNAASKQFDLDVAVPNGYLYVDAYGVKAADNTRYSLPVPGVQFDGIINVDGVASGDKWVVNVMCLATL